MAEIQYTKAIDLKNPLKNFNVLPVPKGLEGFEFTKSNLPKTRAQCPKHPCPHVGCKYHLYLTIDYRGELKCNFPGKEFDEIPQTCALDAADEEGLTLEEVGKLLGITRERVRQIEATALNKLKRVTRIKGIKLDELINTHYTPDIDEYIG